MADKKDRKKPSATRKAGSTSRTRTVTAADRKPKSASKGGAKNQQRSKPAAQTQANVKKPSFVEQYMAYILLAVGVLLSACFILTAIGGGLTTPQDNLMGPVGYYVCYFLFGCLGWTAYLIPLVLFNLAIFWKKCCQEKMATIKVLLSVILMILLSALTHAFVCASDPAIAKTVNVGYLYTQGAQLNGGGVIGGLIGYVMYLGLKLPGSIVIAVLTLPLLIMALVGVTPDYVFAKLGKLFKEWMKKSAEERARKKAEEDEEDEEDEAPKESYRARRAREKAEAAAAAEAEEAEVEEAPATVRVDPATGEILEDEPAPRKKNLLRDRKVKQAEEELAVEEEVTALPLHDPTPVREEPVPAPEPEPAPVEEDEDDGFVRKDFRGAAAPAPRTPVAPVAPLADDTMDVDFGDDTEEVPAVNYEVVTDGSEGESVTRAAGAPTTVRILKADPTALPETGLSEEEVVLSTAHTEEDMPEPAKEHVFPPIELLTRGSDRYETSDAEIAENTQTLRDVLESFNIRVKEISCSCGPTITRFEVKPDSGIRVRSIANLVDDISMGLAKAGVRIEAPIPGKAAVGIEVPNAEPATVHLRNILEAPEFRNHKSRIAACLGADVAGRPVILDINKMPHLLVAGTTGSGKSVCINSIIMSILYKAKPDEVKLILIDPKKVEFAVFRDLPHLYCPLISDPTKAAGALNSAVNEMERRFELIEEVGVRNIAGYNEITAGDPARPPMPQIVIIIDELADLMMTASNEVETAICRLAQKARAAGIHLILGTQRPSTDVITGLIKANIPSRIAFTVTQQIDSRIILDSVGAEKLIGRGDMLFSPVGCNKPVRVQGTFVSDSEVERVVTYIKEHNEKGEFDESFTRQIEIETAKCIAGKKKGGDQMSLEDFDGLGGGGEDSKFWEALEVAAGKEKIGTSALQRALKIGYGRAASIIDRMEELGFVGPDPGTKQGRKVYITQQDVMQYKLNGLPGSGSDAEDGE